MQNLYLSLLGERIRVRSADSTIVERILDVAHQLRTEPFDDPPDLSFRFHVEDGARDLPDFDRMEELGASPYHDFSLYGAGEEGWIVVDGKSIASYRLDRGEVEGRIHPDHLPGGWVIGHRLFFIPLLEWMRHRGHYPVHGSCFRVDRRWVVVSGPSGAGKSTAVLSAIAAGAPFVADDTLFVSLEEEAIRLDSFPESVKVGKGTARFFPEWKEHLVPSGRKFLLPEERLPGPGRRTGVTPSLLLFPEIVNRARSEFEPLPPHEAMIRLMPQSVLPARRDAMERHIRILSRFVESVRSYRLLFGRDLRRLPERIAGLQEAPSG
ncbi:MAG: hypothetical protein JW958_12665 [Candidatus Eisenbacteria bacterium]|nr:hypothetical protein [Candidatus Eisenbacteria bacterium]